MGEPIAFLIVQDLQAALQAIAVARGYHYDVAAMAVKLDPNQAVEDLIAPDGPRPFVLLEVPPVPAPSFEPCEQLTELLPLTVHWVSDSVPTDDNSRMQTFFRGCADVERALTRDGTRGGRAVDTRIGQRLFDASVDGAQVWASIDVVITVHRTYGEPDA